jgi:hypothetical protein
MGTDGAEGTCRVAPHSLQNFAPGALLVLHAGHARTSCAPQPLQNFAPSGLSMPQLGQLICARNLIRSRDGQKSVLSAG